MKLFDYFRKPDKEEVERALKLFGFEDEDYEHLVNKLCSTIKKSEQKNVISCLGTIYSAVYKKVSEGMTKKNDAIKELEQKVGKKEEKISSLEKELKKKEKQIPNDIFSLIINEDVFAFSPEYYDILCCFEENSCDTSTIRRKAGVKNKEIATKLNVLERLGLIYINDNNTYSITELGRRARNLSYFESEKESDISVAVGSVKNYVAQFEKWLNTDRGSDHTTMLIKICKESSCLDEVGKKFFKEVHNDDRKTQEQHMRIKIVDYALAAKITLEKFGINYESLFSKKDSK